MDLTKLVFGLLLLTSVTVPAVAQEFLSQNASRELLQLPLDERRDSVAVADLEFSPDGEHIAIGASDGTVRILGISEGSRPQVIAKGDNPVGKIAFSPDGKVLASAWFFRAEMIGLGGADGRLTIDKPRVLPGSSCVAFSPDGKLLAVGDYSDSGTVVDLTTGENRFALPPFAGAGPVDSALYEPKTLAMDFSPEGNLLAVTTDFFDDELPYFENVQVWDVKTGKLRCFFRGRSCGFSPAADLLAYRSHLSKSDGRIVLLDLDTYLPAGVLTGQFQDAQFAPNGRSMAAMRNQQVELWSITPRDDHSRKCKRVMVLKHATKVTSFAFAPDGHSLATGDTKGAIRIWHLTK